MSKKHEAFNELVAQQPAELSEWLTETHKFLTDSGCKFTNDAKGTFTYNIGKNKKMVCKIKIDKLGCSLRPNTTHILNSTDLIAKLPGYMLDTMRGGRGCGKCAENNPSFVQCKHGGPFEFTYNGERFERCRYFGFNFSLDNATERGLLREWIEMEVVG